MKRKIGCLLLSVAMVLPLALPAFAEEADPVKRFLVFGCDESGELTDVIFIVAHNAKTGEMRALQLPRDTYAAYTSGGYRKLNGALRALGGEECKAFFSRALGVPVHYFAALNLSCVPLLVDAVGGVDLEVPMDMDYSDPAQNLEIHLKKGAQHLSGAQALSFVRFRSGYATADLGRMQAQRAFLQAFAQKCGQLNGADLLRMFFIAVPHMKTDLPVHQALFLSRSLGKGMENFSVAAVPGRAMQGKSEAWFFVLNRQGSIHAVNQTLLPQTPVGEAEFDPDRAFDRPENAAFHQIYCTPAA